MATFAGFSATGNQGLYVGVAGGVNQISGDINQSSTVTLLFSGSPATNITMKPNPAFKRTGGIGTLLAGYNFLSSNRFSLALEGRVSLLNQSEATHASVLESSSVLNITAMNKIKEKNNLNLLIKPGLFLNENSLIYLVGGVAYSDFKTFNQEMFNQNINLGPGFLTLASANALTIKKYKSGSIFGLGTEQKIHKNFSL